MKTVLDVGSNIYDILPDTYQGWRRITLDIDPTCNPDIHMDARRIAYDWPSGKDTFDAVFASHFLEHIYRHEAPTVLAGFLHVLKPGGWAEIHVPNVGLLMRKAAVLSLDLEDFLYDSDAGPIRVVDVLFGYQKMVQESGQDWMCHRYAYSLKSMANLMAETEFRDVEFRAGNMEVIVIAYKRG